MSISVIIPVASLDNNFYYQLQALSLQTYSNWQLVIGLNNSNESVYKRLNILLKEFGFDNYQLIKADRKLSASYARNCAALKADGKYLLFCDADDIVASNWVEVLSSNLSNNSNCAFGGHLAEDKLAIEGQENWRPKATPGKLPSFLGYDYLVSANMAVAKEHYEFVGGFKEDLIRCEDIAFSWDLSKAGVNLSYSPQAIINYRHRKGLANLLKQHYWYGRGFSQLLSRYGTPSTSESTWRDQIRSNNQPVDHKGSIYYARRSAIALGRAVGLITDGFNRV